jgi:Gluconate 2-dehydrogenase subunit 3
MSTLTQSRREAIKKVALLVGGTVMLPDLLKAWGNLTIENTTLQLTAAEGELLAEISETIIPATNTPGAKAAGVPQFVEKLMADIWEPTDRKLIMDGIAAIDAYAKSSQGKGFVACNKEQRIAVLQHFEGMYHKDKNSFPAWMPMKRVITMGYFTSEIGATQTLRYEPVPGRYDGAFPYKKSDRAWAT